MTEFSEDTFQLQISRCPSLINIIRSLFNKIFRDNMKRINNRILQSYFSITNNIHCHIFPKCNINKMSRVVTFHTCHQKTQKEILIIKFFFASFRLLQLTKCHSLLNIFYVLLNNTITPSKILLEC